MLPMRQLKRDRMSLVELDELQTYISAKMVEKYESTYTQEERDAFSADKKWEVRVRALLNTFGALKVFVMFQGQAFEIKQEQIDWIEEAFFSASQRQANSTQSLARPLVRGCVELFADTAWSKDFLGQKLWSQSELVRTPALAHRILGPFFAEAQGDVQRYQSRRAKILTFYSYKGGMGRTTALAFVAKQLADEGKRVFVLDCDLEAPGIHTLLCDSSPDQGLVDFLFHARYKGNLKLKDGPNFVMSASSEVTDGTLFVMPAGNVEDPAYLEKLSYIDIEGIETASPSLFDQLFKQIEKDYGPDYILVDSRTGLTSISGAMLFRYAQHVTAFIYASEQQKYGIRQLADTICSAKDHVSFTWVYTMMSNNEEKRNKHLDDLTQWLTQWIYPEQGTSDEMQALQQRLKDLGIQRDDGLEDANLETLQSKALSELYKPLIEQIKAL